jgi:SAM-dependent methyltransferase
VPARLFSNERLQDAKNIVRDALAVRSTREDIYNPSYYRRVEALAAQSSAALTDVIVGVFTPRSAIDVGCGTGALLWDLRARGVKVLGLDYSRTAIEICRRRGLDVHEHNIEPDNDVAALGRFDVAISTEVAEHVKPDFADTLVAKLVALSDHIVFTAAVPGQGGGVDHVNEQPNSYWIEKFATHGYAYLDEQTARCRAELFEAGAAKFYASNLMLFAAAPARG